MHVDEADGDFDKAETSTRGRTRITGPVSCAPLLLFVGFCDRCVHLRGLSFSKSILFFLFVLDFLEGKVFGIKSMGFEVILNII